MSRLRVPSWTKENWHPSDDELFCYVDGALKAGENQRVKTHLEACWTCRVKGEKIQASIASFVGLLDNVTQRSDRLLPPRQWRTFDAKARKVMSEFARPWLVSRWSATIRDTFFSIYLPFRLVGGVALVLALAALILRFHQTASVSASELIHRAVDAEVNQVRRPGLSVVYQKLQVRRKAGVPLRDDIVTWEIWNDSSSGRFSQRAAVGNAHKLSHVPLGSLPTETRKEEKLGSTQTGNTGQSELTAVAPILLELGQIFRVNRIDGRKPLAPTTYETWRRTIEPKAERVERTELSDGEKALVVSTSTKGPFAPHSIIRADLVVRVKDWHPVSEILRVQGSQEIRDYELTETDFGLLALSSLGPGIFSDIAPQATRAIPQTTSQLVAPAATELVAAEIMARYALHRVKACLGEPIEILSRFDGVRVSGLAETPERKEELIAALQAIPWVTVKIQSLAEAEAAMTTAGTVGDSDSDSNTNTSGELSPVTVRASKLPIQDGLKRYFTQIGNSPNSPLGESERSATDAHQKIVALSSQAISLADTALADAFALRRLAEVYASLNKGSLEASSRWLLEAMIREHVQSIRAATVRSRSLLEPVLLSLEARNEESAASKSLEEVAPVSDWAGQALQLFRTIRYMERLTAYLFAGASLPEAQGGHAVATLLASFNQIDRQSSKLADHVQRSSPDRSDSAVLKQER